MLEVNWTIVTFLLIGLFAFAGLYKGWWKEAITTTFLTILVFLLQLPQVAGALIGLINLVLSLIWGLLSETYRLVFGDIFGLETVSAPPQINPSDGQTWIIILFIVLALAVLVSRMSMPNYGRLGPSYSGYYVTGQASLLGGLLGGINGWLIVSLVRAYLDGGKLPGGSGRTASETVIIQATNVPFTSITDSFLPWFFIGLGILIFIVAIRSRIVILTDKDGYRKIDFLSPVGYERQTVVVVEQK